MAISKAQQRAVNKYIKGNYDRINLVVPKGRKAAIEAHAQSKGESVNGLLNGLLRAELGMSEEAWKHGEGDGGNL
ncbi:MAG TPA: hypothetical protein IAA52_12200 [Candidatus Pullichristensenella stercorigallinarum]|uniref:Uncharacterized protein n=1 Tax=Candidatus Pullichristensenella stercorigallinarum TaxID=2840909 RepID=A0A9D0ZP56_9FIRM|nr:hypothetical protein [Candidatus Pullichristensenella stercorigallinarum]